MSDRSGKSRVMVLACARPAPGRPTAEGSDRRDEMKRIALLVFMLTICIGFVGCRTSSPSVERMLPHDPTFDAVYERLGNPESSALKSMKRSRILLTRRMHAHTMWPMPTSRCTATSATTRRPQVTRPSRPGRRNTTVTICTGRSRESGLRPLLTEERDKLVEFGHALPQIHDLSAVWGVRPEPLHESHGVAKLRLPEQGSDALGGSWLC